MRTTLVVGMATLGMTLGCVSSGKYTELETERDRIEEERASLGAQVETLQAENDQLAARLAESEDQMAAMRGTYDDLVTELRTEVADGHVEIRQLIDGVHLNVSDELLFPSGSTLLNDAGSDLIARVASQIRDEDALVFVEGHTDNTQIGPKLRSRYPTNWELAGARAARVVRLLSEHGVPPERLLAVSHGPFAPVVANDSELGRAKNRRTEIILRPLPR